MTLTQLQTLMADLGCNRILAKELSANDNSKNQVYLGGGFEAVNCFPNLEITQDATGSHGVLFKSSLRFFWVNDDGIQNQAPATQLILYPQYPEVRMSGFLKGCKGAPSRLMASRLQGRILFLGIKGDGDVFGYVSAPDDALTSELLASKHGFETEGVFTVVPTKVILTGDSRIAMMDAFRRIHLCGWIDSKKQRADGSSVPYRAPNGGGYTLEAELGITPNGYSEPDYLGWEVKQHSVVNFKRMGSSILTLMTPEPTAGLYKDSGAEVFIRKYGYPDKMGRTDRMNFGGIHQCNMAHPSTHLTMKLRGYDLETMKITTADGAIVLADPEGNEAASWSFVGLMKHWNRKHNRAVYVPSIRRSMEDLYQYSYGNILRLGIGTDFLSFLSAMAQGFIYYDPGIKLVNASSEHPVMKKRSQFRIHSKHLSGLYRQFETVNVLNQ